MLAVQLVDVAVAIVDELRRRTRNGAKGAQGLGISAVSTVEFTSVPNGVGRHGTARSPSRTTVARVGNWLGARLVAHVVVEAVGVPIPDAIGRGGAGSLDGGGGRFLLWEFVL